MTDNFYTYAHYKPDGTIFYVGKGLGKRAYNLKQRNAYWKRVVEKYGAPRVEILAYWETEQDAFDHEKSLIMSLKKSGTVLVNATIGGEGISGFNHSKLTKQKMQKSHLGKPLTETHKQNIRLAKMGKNNPSFKGSILATNLTTGSQQIFNGAKEMREFGFDHSAVYKCLNNKLQSYKKHSFKRI